MNDYLFLCLITIYCVGAAYFINVFKNNWNDLSSATVMNQPHYSQNPVTRTVPSNDYTAIEIEEGVNVSNKLINSTYHNELEFHCSNEKFNQSLIIIGDWINEAHVQKLTVLLNKDPCQTNKYFAKEILIELLSTYRKTRLRHLLDHINEVIPNYKKSKELATALSVIVVTALGFSHQEKDTKFLYASSLFTDALLASGDTFVCDFILYTLIETTEVTAGILEREDFDSSGSYRMSSSNDKRYTSSNKMEDFLKSIFMTPLMEHDNDEVFTRGLEYFERMEITKNSFKTEAQSISELSKKFISEAKLIRDELHDFCSKLSKNPLETDSTVNYIVNRLIDDKSVAINEIFAKNRFWVTEEHEVETNEEKGYDSHLSYVDIAHLRLKERTLQLQVNKLLTSKRMRFFNTMYNLHLMGYSMFNIRNLIVEMQLSHMNLFRDFKKYKAYVQEYEREVALYRMIAFTDFCWNGCVTQLNNKNQGDPNVNRSLISLVIESVAVITALKHAYDRMRRFNWFYKKKVYSDQMENIYSNVCNNRQRNIYLN